ncbi:unnamed protein product [Phytophthora lilii]|uniref:Unnamed protein product n=1 Tax=Phytophthora lilii TaxID=2077276 RepID=A0A9W6TFK0_9STRA|nr:unnamed protein product [Phytophthora lilii]
MFAGAWDAASAVQVVEGDRNHRNKVKTAIMAAAVRLWTLKTCEAELEPESELGFTPSPEELDTCEEVSGLAVALYRSAEELSSVLDSLAEDSGDEESSLELVEASNDKLMEASIEDSEEEKDALPELGRERSALELELADEEMNSALPAEPEELRLALADVSTGKLLDESPAEMEPALDADESRAVALLIAMVERMKSWMVFMACGGFEDESSRSVSVCWHKQLWRHGGSCSFG